MSPVPIQCHIMIIIYLFKAQVCQVRERLLFPRSPFCAALLAQSSEQCATVRQLTSRSTSCSSLDDLPATLPYLFSDKPARLPRQIYGKRDARTGAV